MRKCIKVGITGGAGKIGYQLLFRVASGEMFGKDQPISLHILELPSALERLRIDIMELHDCAFPLLKKVVVGDKAEEVLGDVDYALLAGAKPRGKYMKRADLLQVNAPIFVEQAKALNRKNVKVTVIGNPVNTNALILKHQAPDLPAENLRSMMRIDQNRAINQLALRAGVDASEVKHVAIYGNHSSTMVADYCNATIGGKPATEVIDNLQWFQGEFLTNVQKRGDVIIDARGFSAVDSVVKAIIDSGSSWFDQDDWDSEGVYSNGNPYGIADDLFFSFPLQGGKIVPGLKMDEFLHEKIRITEQELLAERDSVRGYL